MKYILYGLLAYFLFRLIFYFIIPVYKTSQKIKQQFREMNEKMNGQAGANQNPDQNTGGKNNSPAAGDYIDFEEVK